MLMFSGITSAPPQDNDTFTRLTRNDSRDDWLKRGIRSDAADLYRQQDLNVTLEHDFWGSSGTGGYSDLKAHTTMLQVDAPLADGRMFFRTDLVNMDAGSFSTHSDGSYSPSWGTCGEIACTSGSENQTDSGASVAVGWKNDTWSGDIGTTPMGFNVVDVVGGLSYSSAEVVAVLVGVGRQVARKAREAVFVHADRALHAVVRDVRERKGCALGGDGDRERLEVGRRNDRALEILAVDEVLGDFTSL